MIKKDVNPEWKEDLTLSVTDPIHPFILVIKAFIIRLVYFFYASWFSYNRI